MDGPLLADKEKPAFEHVAGQDGSPFVVVCEHASRTIPSSLADMGLAPQALASHIAWDIGAAGLARALAKRLGGDLIIQRYSRLVYDCNRPPESPDAIVTRPEGTPVPANQNLTADRRLERLGQVYHPFHDEITRVLDQRAAHGQASILVTVHTFTPVFAGRRRAVEVGIVHDADSRLADDVLARLTALGGHDVRRNDPYGPADGVTHTLIRHGMARGIGNVMIEVRNDLVEGPDGQEYWADTLAAAVIPAAGRFAPGDAASTGAGR